MLQRPPSLTIVHFCHTKPVATVHHEHHQNLSIHMHGLYYPFTMLYPTNRRKCYHHESCSRCRLRESKGFSDRCLKRDMNFMILHSLMDHAPSFRRNFTVVNLSWPCAHVVDFQGLRGLVTFWDFPLNFSCPPYCPFSSGWGQSRMLFPFKT